MKVAEVGGDLASSAGAFAGLVLVFIGFAISGIEGYDAEGLSSVRNRYRRRAWPAFFALLAALGACFAGLWGKAEECGGAVWTGAALLALSALGIVFAAFQLLLEIG